MNNDLREMYRQADCARLAAENARVQQQIMRDDAARRAAEQTQQKLAAQRARDRADDNARLQRQISDACNARRAAEQAQFQRNLAPQRTINPTILTSQRATSPSILAGTPAQPLIGPTHYAPPSPTPFFSLRKVGAALACCLVALIVLGISSAFSTTSPGTAHSGASTRYTVSAATRNGLNLRSLPSAKSRILLNIPIGGSIQMLNETRQNGTTRWVRVRYGAATGWVVSAYLL